MARRAIPAALALALAAALHAQTDPTQSAVPEAGFSPPAAATAAATTTPTIRVFSRETIIDVLVTDDKGHPVRGLTRSDFTILEDNHPQPIRGFTETSGADSAPTPAPALPPNTYANAQTLPTNGPVQIILIQRPIVQFAPPPGIFVPQGLLDYLRSMTPGTSVAVFDYCSLTGLELVQDFTTDGAAAAAAAARIQPVVGTDYRGPAEVIFHISALEQLAAYVAAIHGSKNLIWMQGTIPIMLDRDGGYEYGLGPNGQVLPAHDITITHRLVDLYEIFSREQIAIYPVDPNGIHKLGLRTIQTQEIVDQTGGTYGNTNDIKGEIADIVDRSSDAYTLSFIPPRPIEDSHFYSIKVLVDRPGLTLTYRTGYNDDHPHPPDRMLQADLLPAPMRVGALPTTQLLFNLQAAPTPPSNSAAYAAAEAAVKQGNGGGKTKLADSLKGTPYDVIFHFDPKQIASAETPGGARTANIEFDLGAFDSNAKLVVARSQIMKIALSPTEYDEFMNTPFQFYLPIPLPQGQLTLRAGLFDTVSGKAGTLEIPLTIPKR
jgi:VWFA-related protein